MWPRLNRPLNIAHRGASKVSPENTLPAFRKALDLGADGIELDVRLSADGVPVVIHDATVDATSNGSGRVDRKTVAELKQLNAEARLGATRAGLGALPETRIPALAEVLDGLGQELLINIELKGVRPFDGRLEHAVVEQVNRFGLRSRVLLSSFNPLALRRIQRIDPNIPTGLICLRPTWPSLGLASLIVEWPTRALHPHHSLVDAEFVRRAHEQGVRVHTWTVDDPALMRRLIALNVDGIITNAPDILVDILRDTT